MAGAKLDLTTDTSQFKKGMKGAEDIIESVGETFDDLAKDAEGAAEDMEKSFAEYARETKQEASKLGKQISGAQEVAAVDVDKANEKMGDSAQSKAREVAASFDGSAESIVAGFQGAAAEAFEGFGPAGVAAGLAAAAGLGLITSEMERQKEEAAKAAEAAWDMAQQMVEAGIYMVTENQKIEAFEALVGDQEQRDKFQTQLDNLGISWTDFVAAQVGLGAKREEIEGRIQGYYDDQIGQLGDIGSFDDERLRVAQSLRQDQERILDPIRKQAEIQEDAVDTALDIRRTYQEAGVELENNVTVLNDGRRAAEAIAETDATPQFDMTPAFDQLSRFQRELMRLRVPDLNVRITRTIQ